MRRQISLAIVVVSALAAARGRALWPSHGPLIMAVTQAGAWQSPAQRLAVTTWGSATVIGKRSSTVLPPSAPPAPATRSMGATAAVRRAAKETSAQTILAVARSTGDRAYTVAGSPTISVTTIDAVLARYNSPMAGAGQTIYDLGVTYGIDPVYCLAFFVQESAAGTRGEAVLTRNMGNIRAQAGEPSLDGYHLYKTWGDSVRDWYRLIRDVYIAQWQLDTVDQIVPVYAPADDSNDVAAYIADVEALVSTWRAQD